MQISHILETALYTADLPAAEDFYTRVLGLETFSRVEGRHLFFRLADAMLLIFNPEQTALSDQDVPPHGARGPGHVAFTIQEADFAAWREHLESESVEIEKEVEWPRGGRSLYFRDPAGNSLELASARIWGFSFKRI
jgi:catechol 2,3-dioxygenase-like lactoylglutathione lyase family enzyme